MIYYVFFIDGSIELAIGHPRASSNLKQTLEKVSVHQSASWPEPGKQKAKG